MLFRSLALGLPHGKTEAWYILSAEPGARVALGLTRSLTQPELRIAILDGSIEHLVQWRPVVADDVILIPAGTIHAIGAGLVVAEIQQTSDTTFRLFDFKRGRALHVDDAVAVADAGRVPDQPAERRLTDTRLLLAISPYFVLERIDLSAATTWQMKADQETWLLVLDGHCRAGRAEMQRGDVLYLDKDRIDFTPGAAGLKALVAYVGTKAVRDLLRNIDERRPSRSPFEPISHSTETAA